METKRGWIVVGSGLGVNLMLGVLYAWGVISAALIDQLGWSATMTQMPYMVACAVFALSMVPGGRLQDRFGPRPVIMAAALLAGVGFVLSGYLLTPIGLIIFFGVVFGFGMGMGYAAPTPAAVKWFAPEKRGVISGIVVSGFGLAPLYIAPLTNYLLGQYGLNQTFIIIGIGFFIMIITLAQFIKNPPDGYVVHPKVVDVKNVAPEKAATNNMTKRNYEWHEVLKTKQFYLLWIMFSFGTFAGLLIIGQLAKIGLEQAGMANAYLLVAIYAIFNCSGRIGCGFLSDHLGRIKTLKLMFALQVVVYAFFVMLTSPLLLIIGVSVVGFTFGGMLSLFPSATADYYGIKHFGVNYGMLITAWGVGGVLGPLLGGLVRDLTGTYAISYAVASVLSALGIWLAMHMLRPDETTESQESDVVLEME